MDMQVQCTGHMTMHLPVNVMLRQCIVLSQLSFRRVLATCLKLVGVISSTGWLCSREYAHVLQSIVISGGSK